MTAQIGDIYKYHDKDYAIVARTSPGLFCPRDYVLEIDMISTACWRGHWCKYTIEDDKLILNNLYLFNKEGKYPPPALEELVDYVMNAGTLGNMSRKLF